MDRINVQFRGDEIDEFADIFRRRNFIGRKLDVEDFLDRHDQPHMIGAIPIGDVFGARLIGRDEILLVEHAT